MARHLKKSEKSKKPFIILVLILCVLCCIAFWIVPYIESSSQNDMQNEKDNIFELTSHTFSNATYLDSQNFTLTVDGGISTINGTIVNNSDKIINNLKCLYTLKDTSNDIVYSFDISINNIEAHASSSFACMAILDLSNIADYSVSIIEQ